MTRRGALGSAGVLFLVALAAPFAATLLGPLALTGYTASVGAFGLLAIICGAFTVGLASGRYPEALASAAGAVAGLSLGLLLTTDRAGSAASALAQLGVIVGLVHAWGAAGRQLAVAIDERLATG